LQTIYAVDWMFDENRQRGEGAFHTANNITGNGWMDG